MIPDVNPDNEVRLAVYRHFVAMGEAPSVETVARSAGRTVAETRAAFMRLAEAHVLVLRPGTSDLWMAMPFSAVPTAFLVRSGSRSWWANCAWDALGIAALGTDVVVEAACAGTGVPLPLAIRKGRLFGEGLVHFAVPAARWWDDIGHT